MFNSIELNLLNMTSEQTINIFYHVTKSIKTIKNSCCIELKLHINTQYMFKEKKLINKRSKHILIESKLCVSLECLSSRRPWVRGKGQVRRHLWLRASASQLPKLIGRQSRIVATSEIELVGRADIAMTTSKTRAGRSRGRQCRVSVRGEESDVWDRVSKRTSQDDVEKNEPRQIYARNGAMRRPEVGGLDPSDQETQNDVLVHQKFQNFLYLTLDIRGFKDRMRS